MRLNLPGIFGFRKRRELLEEINYNLAVLKTKQETGFKEFGILLAYHKGRVFSVNSEVNATEIKATKQGR